MDEKTNWDALSQSDFIESPDVADFVTRENDSLRLLYSRFPYIRLGKILSGNFALLYMPEEYADKLVSEPDIDLRTNQPTMLVPMGRLDLDSSGILAVQQNQYMNLHGKGVIVGFVDTGIDYTQTVFQHEDKTTKIKYIWDQTVSGSPPEDFGFGSEYNENAVNEALAASNPREMVPHEDSSGHGTFLASVAAGSGVGAAPEANIIAVKLRRAREYHLRSFLAPPETDNVYGAADVMLGVEYILSKASQLSMPAVICIGLGTNASSHTGNTILDDYLLGVGARTGVAICAAAGNEALSGHHFHGTIDAPEKKLDIHIRCEGENISGGISLGIFTGSMDRVTVSLTSPLGEVIARRPVKTSSVYTQDLVMEKSVIMIEYYLPTSKSGSQLTVIQIKDPTPGIWTATLHGEVILEGGVHAWLPSTGFGNAGIKFLTPNSYYTVTEPGVAVGVITVGAYSALSGSLYPHSSWGPTRLPALAPDLTAPGEKVTGIFPSGPGSMSGTSVAAAITAGTCALMMEWGIVKQMDLSLNTAAMKTYLIRGCVQDTDKSYPNEQWGFGRLNLLNTFMKMR